MLAVWDQGSPGNMGVLLGHVFGAPMYLPVPGPEAQGAAGTGGRPSPHQRLGLAPNPSGSPCQPHQGHAPLGRASEHGIPPPASSFARQLFNPIIRHYLFIRDLI